MMGRFARRHRRLHALLPVCVACMAQGNTLDADADLFELSLGELLQLEVTSVAKKSQRVSEAAAAVFVITAEDIRRSGATSIPEVLRMAPGIEVAQVDANKWAISARGFQNRFSNKLLVLMDGRTLYSPLFSGVFWDAQDSMLEDIQRIEVIRGPGATLWGANAVNGVINIITRESSESGGLLFSAGGGNQERGFGSLRYGSSIGDNGDYRIYFKHFDRRGNRVAESDASAADDWQQTRVGFRSDFAFGAASTLTLQGDAYRGESGETVIDFLFESPYRQNASAVQDISGYNLLARWQLDRTSGDQLSVQTFVDSARRDWDFVDLDRTTLDLDIDYRTERFDRHDLLFGMNYRNTRDHIDGSDRLRALPPEREEELFSAFVQDEITLIPETLSLVLGMKLEINDYTGDEYQPNARLLWKPRENMSIWASAARAVRTPGRLDRDVKLQAELTAPVQPGGLPTVFYVLGNRDFEAETLVAYEAGFKHEFDDRLAWDIAFFANDYDRVRSFGAPSARCEPVNAFPLCLADPSTRALALDSRWVNEGDVESFGLEWAGTWAISPAWRVKGAYSFIDVKSSAPEGTVPEVAEGDPRHQLSVRLAHQPSDDIDMDMWLRFVDEVTVPRTMIDAYTTLDARVAWRPTKRSEISLTGRNLLDSARVQFLSELGDVPEIGIQRSIHLQLSYEL